MKHEIKNVLKKVSPIIAPSFHPLLLLLCWVLFSFVEIAPGNAQNRVIQGLNGGFYAECSDGRVLYDRRAGDSFIPASTLKLVTAAAAIKNLGEDYRFKTDFLVSPNGDLIIRGYGDPTLISEEVLEIATQIAGARRSFNDIIVDGSEFETELHIDGRSNTLNPYDARNGAVVVNFNTVAIEKLGNGKIRSGEPQTPLTPTAMRLGVKQPIGSKRISVDDDPVTPLRYAGELFREFLMRAGVKISGDIKVGQAGSKDKLLLTHSSSKPLKIVLRDVLEYSSNFGANQLLLVMGQEKYGGKANLQKGLRVINDFAHDELHLNSLKLAEGSGLSRNNRVSPKDLVRVLGLLSPYRQLLNVYKSRRIGMYLAKTGTINGVSSLAGFAIGADCDDVRFAVIINDQVANEVRHRAVDEMLMR